MATAKSAGSGTVTLKRLEDAVISIDIIGVTPYIPEKWSEKAKAMMPGHPEKEQVRAPKGAREPEEEARARVYRLSDGRTGIPASAIKAAMVGACRLFEGMTMVEAKMKFYVMGDGKDDEGTDLIAFTGTPILREDTPRNSNGGADLRYRYAFNNWKATIKISYLPGLINEESILALLDAGGRGGVGGWRPSAPKSATGTFGMWRVVTSEER